MKSDIYDIRHMLGMMNIPYEEEQLNNKFLIKVIRGYADHYTLFSFDLDGSFNDIGAFE